MNLHDIFPVDMWRPVLIIDAPTKDIHQLAELRHYVMECLDCGVLVLPEDCSYRLEALPLVAMPTLVVEEAGQDYQDLAGKVAFDLTFPDPWEETPERDIAASESEPEPEPEEAAWPRGHNRAEKRAIQARLKAYRKAHGLGCWADVAKASGGAISDDQLRDMHNGGVNFPIAEWRLAAKALEKAGEAK